MKNLSVATVIYAIILIIGGVIGYLKAGSPASIIASSIFGAGLLASSVLEWKKHPAGYYAAIALGILLLSFFIYRFAITLHFMPSGMMVIIAAFFLAYFFYAKKEA